MRAEVMHARDKLTEYLHYTKGRRQDFAWVGASIGSMSV